MKTDKSGTSTCPRGEERHERFQLPDRRGRMRWFVQYDYRHTNGGLFSCVRSTLAECREARDQAIANDTIN